MSTEEEKPSLGDGSIEKSKPSHGFWDLIWVPLNWFRMLARETHWSFVLGVVVVYGISQGLGGGLSRVGIEYYRKDVQKAQPSEAQVYSGIVSLPWIFKLLFGLLTDVFPVAGYGRRPYFMFAGVLGIISMLSLALHKKLQVVFSLLSLTAGSAAAAIADVTIDACVAQNCITHHSLAADMQSFCGPSSSIGALIAFSVSGFLVHIIGPKGVFGLLVIPAALVVLVGMVLIEPHMPNFAYIGVPQKLLDAIKAIWRTLKCPDVWRPCAYMYLSVAVSLNIQEGMFYWYTDQNAGPSFSQENVGFIFSIGSVGSLFGVLLYQNILKDHPFRALLDLWCIRDVRFDAGLAVKLKIWNT